MSMKKWIIEDMCDRLDNWEGHTVYIGDLVSYIYQSPMVDGSILYSTYETREWIGKYMHDIAEAIEDYGLDEFERMDFSSAFTNPEAFHVDLVTYLAGDYIFKSEWIREHEDEEIELTEEVIETIKKELLEAI